MIKTIGARRALKKAVSISRGLTLIEVVVGMAVVVVILVALVTLYTSGQKYFINESTKADALEDSRYPLAWISRDVKEASQVISSWGGYTTSANCLVLEMPSLDENGLIVDINSIFDYIIYRLNSGKLERIIDANDGVSSRVDSTKVLANNVDSLAITYFDSMGGELPSNFDNASSIDIALTSSRNGLGRTFQETLSAVIKLRNKAIS